jgi:rare lipoprotein A
MVRSMYQPIKPSSPASSDQSGARHAVAFWLGAGMLAASALLAGCASQPEHLKPAPNRATAPSARPVAERALPPAASSERDGAPAEAPPNLAALPDPVPQVEPIKPGGPNKPYVVLGQSYEPTVADVRWKESGLASWYGTKFHGRRTASGELFNMYGLTAAHRTLPIPSYAKVRNLKTGKEIIVRVNDRGPFHSARVMDLSYAAAVKLGIHSLGSAQVEIERLTFDEIRTGAWRRGTVLDPEPEQMAVSPLAPVLPAPRAEPPPAVVAGSLENDPIETVVAKAVSMPAAMDVAVLAAQEPPSVGAKPDGDVATAGVASAQGAAARAYTSNAKGFWVQLAALAKLDGVDRLQQRIAADLASIQPMLAVFHEATYFKLQVGPYGTRDQAMAAAQQVRTALQLNPLVIERR